MTGILIFTAGREDAFEDYKRSVRDGHSLDELAPHLDPDERDQLGTYYEDDVAHLWGTSVANKWQKVEPGDIALVYRDGQYIARAEVVHTTANYDLAKAIWDTADNPWDEDSPWSYLTFVTDVQEIEVDAEAFNDLVEYDPSYRPQGFTRVADRRIQTLLQEWESVENALADLTGTGEKVHVVDDDPDEQSHEEFVADLIAASKDGDRGTEFEELVAEAFSRLGFDAQWIEGGGDTDVELTAPIHAVVEAKARSSPAGVSDVRAPHVKQHREQRGADHGFVIGRHFPPGAVTAATDNDLTTITSDVLGELLAIREQYGTPPEVLAEQLTIPGQVQDDRLDDLRAYEQDRVESMAAVLQVLRALSKVGDGLDNAAHIRMIAVGMTSNDEAPSEAAVEDALALLTHPSIGLVAEGEAGYRLVTSYENALARLRRFGTVIDVAAGETADSEL